MTLLFQGVRLLAPDTPDGTTPPTDVLVEGSRIAAVGQVAPPPGARVVDGRDRLLLPGLINGHFHSPVNHMAGSLEGLPLELFMLYESPALPVLRPTPHEAYVRTLLGVAAMLRTGVTAVQDDAFFVPGPEPAVVDAVLQAYADSGLRATVALDQPELPEADKLPFLVALASPGQRAELERQPEHGQAALLEAYDHLIGRWHGHDGGRLRAAVSCSAPQRVSPAYFAALDALSRRHSLPIFAHMLETRTQRVLADTQARFAGRSLVRYTADLGLLSSRMNVIHAIWVDERDLDLIAEAGCTVAHNPVCNLRLGSGVMPFRRIRDRGIPVCLGTDEAAADDSVNLWGAVKAAGLVHTLADADSAGWPRANEVLDCVWHGGARAMGLAGELGAIAPGYLADLALVDLDTLAFTPLNNAARQLVYCETGSSVRMTVVAGRIVFEDGRIVTLDEPALRAEARAIFTARRPALEAARREADRWLPPYRAMLARAEAHGLAMNRRLGDSVSGRPA